MKLARPGHLLAEILWAWNSSGYHRDRPGSLPLRDELLEEHWSYMDQYAKEMIARVQPSPMTATRPPEACTSSTCPIPPPPARSRLRGARLPDRRVPGMVLLRRWRNLLGRTMWDFPGGRTGGNRYLVLGLGTGQAADLAVPPDRELIAYGCCCPDRRHLAGHGGAAPAPDPDTARAILTPDRYADIEAHSGQFGGRPS